MIASCLDACESAREDVIKATKEFERPEVTELAGPMEVDDEGYVPTPLAYSPTAEGGVIGSLVGTEEG